ncbi:MlaC/ttg2D family ABC transporter substrate-binding protein [Roseospira goensis]|uniref:Phospholipid transport system substrate-binding protein n=1 Tax=Roseospira goensis TaxID=391922 RepID=A0A7W6WKH9_9PROT|nr:ABC transporter substrate-binding protein [Roseospira goensis]MBB4286125.1 phospholipid transport system substrate-binding protein [Roseospira goensis]
MTPTLLPSRLLGRLRPLLLVVALAVALPLGARAADLPTEPDAFIKAVADRAIDEILQPDISTDDRISKFETLLEDAFDLETVGRFVVGRAWRSASDAERERFLDLFKDFNVFNWGSRFDEYGGQALQVTNVVPDDDKGYFIETRIGNQDGKPFLVTWRVRKREGGLRIVDISVEGIWMSQTWRSEYASVLKEKGSLTGLNETLEQRVAELREKTEL